MIFHIIGIGNKTPDFTTEQQQSILDTCVFSGGRRHYELVKDYLPKNHQWIAIQSPMSQVFEVYEKAAVPIIVFASEIHCFMDFRIH